MSIVILTTIIPAVTNIVNLAGHSLTSTIRASYSLHLIPPYPSPRKLYIGPPFSEWTASLFTTWNTLSDLGNTMSHCHDEHVGHGAHDHHHDHEHDHSDDITPALQSSLYQQINFDEITTLNESTRDAGKAIVKKTWAERLSAEPELASDADEQLLMTVPYVSSLTTSNTRSPLYFTLVTKPSLLLSLFFFSLSIQLTKTQLRGPSQTPLHPHPHIPIPFCPKNTPSLRQPRQSGLFNGRRHGSSAKD